MTATTGVVALVVGLAGASAAGGATAAPAGAFELLNGQSLWRFHAAWRTPATVADGTYDLGGGHPIPAGGTRWILNSFTEPTPPPPTGWTVSDFDDSGWPRLAEPPFGGYGYGPNAEIYLLCARARFGVSAPGKAGPLTLQITYRGGVVVYLNGREIARGHLPPGDVQPLALAQDYEREAFVGPDGAPLRPPSRGKEPPEALGWARMKLLWGTGGDNLPNEEIVAFFRKIAPDMRWRVVTHGGSVPNWGPTDEQRTQKGGLVVGYANVVRRRTAVRPELAAEAKAAIQALMDVMENNRRVRPAGTADVWPLVRRIYQLASELLPGHPRQALLKPREMEMLSSPAVICPFRRPRR